MLLLIQPVLGMLLINAMAACERLIIPVQTEFLALKGLERIVHTLNMPQSQHKPLEYSLYPQCLIVVLMHRRLP